MSSPTRSEVAALPSKLQRNTLPREEIDAVTTSPTTTRWTGRPPSKTTMSPATFGSRFGGSSMAGSGAVSSAQSSLILLLAVRSVGLPALGHQPRDVPPSDGAEQLHRKAVRRRIDHVDVRL